MKKLTSILFVLLITCTIVSSAYAEAPHCFTSSSGPYCKYTGTVSRAYVNDNGNILLYFDTAMDLNEPSSVGIPDVTIASATVVRYNANEFFAKSFYATILAAQSRGATVHVQMRGAYGGYLMADRIWLHE